MDALENIIQIIEKDTNEKIIKLKEENDIKCKNIISEAEKCAKKEIVSTHLQGRHNLK